MGETVSAVTKLATEAGKIGVQLDTAMQKRFVSFVDTLLFWRQRLSLTSADSAGMIASQHILDSLHVARWVDGRARIADLGSGAGFPAIPLAIVLPGQSICMIEARRKRANFLREVIRQCDLTNATVMECRAEDINSGVDPFDVVTSRAFSSLPLFFSLAAPLLCNGGMAVAMKGPAVRNEPLAHHDYTAPRLVDYTLPDGRQRVLVLAQRRARFT